MIVEVLLSVLRCQLIYEGQVVTNAEARFNKSLRPRKPEGSLGRTAQDVHLDSHTAPELCLVLSFILHRAAPASRWQAASDWREGGGGTQGP